MKYLGYVLSFLTLSSFTFATQLPSRFDLRNVDGKSYVSDVKSQLGGTSWAYGTTASLESNLMKNGVWASEGEKGAAKLSEEHLDWWNGFNQHYNADIVPHEGGTLAVHEGGDYRMAAAYLARYEGIIRWMSGTFYYIEPEENASYYHRFYARNIEWLSSSEDIKKAILNDGAVASAVSWNRAFYAADTATFYQPVYDGGEPNHGIALVGWDDQKVTQAARPGAWLAKNSWGTRFGEGGYFWIAYDDKVVGKDPDFGAVSFYNVQAMYATHIYYHDYHGWRDTRTDVSEALNAFVAKGGEGLDEKIKAVSFYTAAENLTYTAKVYGKFDGQTLSDELASLSGQVAHPGHHTFDLKKKVLLEKGQHFYVYLKVSAGGHAVDRSSTLSRLLDNSLHTLTVESAAKPGESYYLNGTQWLDLTRDDFSANFCMKALTVRE